MEKQILHVDVNNAFLSWTAVEMLKKGENIDIRTIPSVIGGDETRRAGIVLAKSMKAKECGIFTGETLYQARQKCSNLKVYPGNYRKYKEYSDSLFKLLSEYTDYAGNFQQITRMLLYKIKKIGQNHVNNNIFCIPYDNYQYNYIITDDLLYLCMSFKDNINISQKNYLDENILICAFLFDLRKFFLTQYNYADIKKAKSYEYQDFDNTIQLLIEYYNVRPSFTKSGLPVYNLINEDKNIIIENLNKYFNSDETLNMTVFQNEAYNIQTVTKQNKVLLDYNKRKEKIEQIKTIIKLLTLLIGFVLVLYLFVHFFGNKENIRH